MKTSITARVTFAVIAIHAILLPALYYGLGIVVRGSHTDLFVQHVRTFARNLAEEMEIAGVLDSQNRIVEFLDRAILSADGVYAELVNNGVSTRSNLNTPGLQWPGRQDFAFGEGGDGIYRIALPVARGDHSAELRLGFDERPTVEQVRVAMQRTLWALAAYLGVALSFAFAFGLQLARPVVDLKRMARRIASGNYVQSLRLESGIRELHELGTDLEAMRKELVGVNERLRAEIGERERIELRRVDLETRLRHRQRVETVGALAGGIAHEINNALLPVLLLAEAALADLPPESAVRGDVEGILSSARHAKEIVAKVLLFTRERGVGALELIDLEAVVREALRLFGLLVPPSVQLHTELAGPYPPVRAEPALAVQLIMNLCTNAYQSLGGESGTLTVGLSVATDAGSDAAAQAPATFVVLRVSDTGHGMSAETLERIFEPFFTTREVGRGSGLGLAVVHGIVESFGASIRVQSKVGEGTTFTVYFPVAPHRAPVDSSSSDVREMEHDKRTAH